MFTIPESFNKPMLRSLYHLFIPKSLRTRLYLSAVDQYKQETATRHAQVESTIPQIDLEAPQIAHLTVVLDRESLLARLPKQGIVAEIGVDRGEFSQAILSRTLPRKLHLIDSWVDSRHSELAMKAVMQRFSAEIAGGAVEIQHGQSRAELEKFADGYFDWVYLDTDHSYETTVGELEVCRRKLKAGGILAGHDYVARAASGYRYGVVEAVHGFCRQYGWEMIYLTHETHRHLSFALIESSHRKRVANPFSITTSI